jgi:hypothetical protein
MTADGLRKRTRLGTFIPRSVLRDRRLSFRARGLLCYLPDKPAAWGMRADTIAHDNAVDGRDKVLSVLRELGVGGCRLERRRLADGQFTMRTATSKEPCHRVGSRPAGVISSRRGACLSPVVNR